MNKMLFAAAMIAVLLPAGAYAQERAGDAALGAVSGAVVLGPVGAVAGAFIGYAAGPSIAQSWGLRHSRRAKPRQHSAANGAPPAIPSPAPRPGAPAATGGGSMAQMRAGGSSSAPPTSSAPAPSAATANSAPPPVQGFD